jgi:prolyl 4-hydroxylase
MMEMLTEFWESNKEDERPESWPAGNTYTNHWTSPTYLVSVEEQKHKGGGPDLKERIWDAAQSTIQAWTGEQLTPCSLYGIRVYKEGSILASHVDRLPLVSSAIINVAQDVDEDWPIEVYAHDGKAYNITMQPGDMVLYESHSVIHGRPFPLKGRYYANVFIHFEPTGHSLRHEAKVHGEDPVASYQNAMEKDDPAVTDEQDGLPSYIVRGSPEESRWRQDHGMQRKKVSFGYFIHLAPTLTLFLRN